MEDDNENEKEMVVAGLVVDPVSNAPIVVLKDPEGDTCLPIWIGMSEASSIASALKGVEMVRPMTHDLLKESIETLGAKVKRIGIVSLAENTFYATIEIAIGEVYKELDARPSDAIALAVRCNVPVYVNKVVLDQAQATLVPIDSEDEKESDGEEVHVDGNIDAAEKDFDPRRFAELDKEQLSEMLKSMDPDDFKYKM